MQAIQIEGLPSISALLGYHSTQRRRTFAACSTWRNAVQILAPEQSPQQQMTNRLDALANALDGFPVQALLADCLDSAAAAPANTDRKNPKDHTALLVDRVLNRWIERLGQDIEQLPPSTLEVLRAISQRTHATREALIEVRALFDRLIA
jgi:hypothetical protein